MKDYSFYQSHLDRVSRSFAFCIRKLDPPFRQWVSLSYLMCRILDTVEDSRWPDRQARERQYREFGEFLAGERVEERIGAWAKRFPVSIPEGERLLLNDAEVVFAELRDCPPEVRRSIVETVRKMAAGMRYYSSREKDGTLRLENLTDVNRYCYFVAGVVGELLSLLLLSFRPDFQAQPHFMKNAFHFGLFLQKVNLLKDQRTDEREGRFLIPDRKVVLSSLRENAEGAISYLIDLPSDEAGYRVFCAWSLFLGAASLSWIEKSYDADDGSKIPRRITEDLLAAIESIALDNMALKGAFDEHFPTLPALPESRDTGNPGDWFIQLCGSTLAQHELAELRMI